MRKQKNVISILVFFIMTLNLILPSKYADVAFAYSPVSKSGVEQNESKDQKVNQADDDLRVDQDESSILSNPEEMPDEAIGGLNNASEGSKEESDGMLEDSEEISNDNLLEDEKGDLSAEEDSSVLSGGLYDEPISTWSFNGLKDLNKDGVINSRDLSLVAARYNAKKGQANYSAGSDFNGDGIIDIYDLVIVSSNSGSKGKIAIDPGHGGSDAGAVGPSGIREKDITLKVGLKVRDLLESYGYTVVMTRTTDTFVSLQERCDIANNSNADLFVSIHNNSFGDPSANGTETFSYFSYDEGGQVARSIQSKLVSALGLRNRGTKTADFYVLRNTKMPAALTELAFISNPTEEALLNTEDFQNKAAKAIVDGIIGY